VPETLRSFTVVLRWLDQTPVSALAITKPFQSHRQLRRDWKYIHNIAAPTPLAFHFHQEPARTQMG